MGGEAQAIRNPDATPGLYEAGQTAAADQNRSPASLMETLLVEHLRANGYLPGSGRPYGKEVRP